MSKHLFVVGTGTDVGKTYVTGLILKKLREAGKNPAYYKAAMSGNLRDCRGRLIPGDGEEVKRISGIRQSVDEMCPYVYEAAVSPHLAARQEGNPVDMSVVKAGFQKVADKYDYVTMEGSGGIICPLRFDEQEIYLEDAIDDLGMGCVIVAHAGLGTINHAGLTAFYMKQRNIPVKGMIFNGYLPGDPMQEDNIKMCEHITGVKVLARVKTGDDNLDMSQDLLEDMYL